MNEIADYKIVNRGEIFYMSFGSAIGSEQQKSRPAVIISNDNCNWHSPVVTVLPITSKDKKPLPTHTRVPEGLPIRGIVMAEQIQTVSKSRLGDYIGEFDDKTMRKIDETICVQCAIERKLATDTTALQDELKKERELRVQLETAFEELKAQLASFDKQSINETEVKKWKNRAQIFEQLYKEEVRK